MRPTSPARLWLAILAAAAAASLWAGAPAAAQSADWPRLARQLASDKPEEVKAARTDLTARFSDINFSVAERTAASAQVVPVLREHVQTGGEPAIQALLVAGDVATDASVDLLDEARALSAADARYAAVLGFSRTFERVNTAPPAINAAKVKWMISRLGEGLRTEAEASIADAYVRGLIRASRLSQSGLGEAPVAAFRALTASMSARVGSLKRAPADDAFMTPLIRAAEEARNVVVGDALQKKLPAEAVCDAAALAGDVLAYLYHRLRAGEAGGWGALAPGEGEAEARAKVEARRAAFTLAQLAEVTIIYIKDRNQIGAVGEKFGLGEMIQNATPEGDRRFLDPAAGDANKGVLRIIGPGGLLMQFNCGFPNARFLRDGGGRGPG